MNFLLMTLQREESSGAISSLMIPENNATQVLLDYSIVECYNEKRTFFERRIYCESKIIS